MRPLILIAAAAAVALLAGCTNSDGDEGDDNGGTGGAPNTSTNTTTSIAMDFAAGGPGPLAPDGGGTVDVPANASALLLEARWECTSPTCDIAITLVDDEGTPVGTATGDGDATLSVPNPGPGTYTVEFATQAPVAGVQGEARLTVFQGAVPEGFTAFDEEAAALSR